MAAQAADVGRDGGGGRHAIQMSHLDYREAERWWVRAGGRPQDARLHVSLLACSPCGASLPLSAASAVT